MHVENILDVGLKSRCDVFQDNLNLMVPAKNSGELRWYEGCHYSQDWKRNNLTIFQKPFAVELLKKSMSLPSRVFHFELM